MKTFIRFCRTTMVLLSCYITIDIAYSQSCGILDLSFGNNGKVITDFGSADLCSSIAVQTDGKIIAAGYSIINNGWDFAIVRYNIDGSIDNTFGINGHVFTDFYSRFDYGLALALLKDEKILVAGSAHDTVNTLYFAVARYNNNGTLDSSFNGNGKVLIYSGGVNDAVNCISVQDDGKIILGGFIHEMDFCIMRLNVNGTLDSTFNGCGIDTTDFLGHEDYCYSTKIQADGKIIAAGGSSDNNFDYFSMARYNTDGSPDTTFGNSGKVLTNLGAFSCSRDIIIQPDLKIILAGYATYDIALVRYNPDGSLDPSFGINGIVKTDFFGWTNYSMSLLYQPDQKIIVGGYACTQNDCDFALVRYNPDGSLDNTFGTGGKVTTDFGSDDAGWSLAFQSDSTIVLGGFTGDMMQSDIALARYKCEPAGIKTIQNDSKVQLFPNPATDIINLDCPGKQHLIYYIYNIIGELVLHEALNDSKTEIDISALPAGMYIIKVTGADWIVEKKIIKE